MTSPVLHCLFAWSLLVIGAISEAASAQSPPQPTRHRPTSAERMRQRLNTLVRRHQGQVSVLIKHLPSGETYRYRSDEPMPTASLIKLPIMIEAYRQAQEGKIDLTKHITLRVEDQVPGSGVLTTHFSPGAVISLRDAIRLMIVFSDNTATNLVLQQIGLKSVAEAMKELGCRHTKIHSLVYRRDTSIDAERSKRFGLGSTTAAETARLLERLHQGELAGEANAKTMLDHLLHCEDDTKIVAGLPPSAKFAHKTGTVSATRCDAGIFYSSKGPVVICVLTTKNKDRRWTKENAAQKLCAEIGRIVARRFHPQGVSLAGRPQGPLKLGASGNLVEALQRTLNARLSPSPELAVDGDFGPNTQSAVIRFQQVKNLSASGVVDPKTWQALGPLLMADQPAPPPEEINSQKLSRRQADSPSGPPFVTCKAWAIADAETGQVLAGSQQTKRLPFASTTKIMTAHLVIKLAEQDPKILEEVLTFSPRADATGGSTAGVRAGEKLAVGELLYGLLLPSGNDASVALAEHFGDRFPADETSTEDAAVEADPLLRFVAEMNREAARLEMTSTRYHNPHGLSANGHVSTAADLVKLTHAAMRSELFRKYVSTRQRGCALRSEQGYVRHVVWKNTNRLLAIEGYQGVKTGTTRAAGACLVSTGRRNDQQLHVIVLGSTSSDARYIDARNLFRWGWTQFGGR